jgi:tRNA-specific 2-thiouridylase
MGVERKNRVVVAMSGGVDSSVAAGLLVERGYDVIGITIKTHRYEDVGGNAGNESSCCSLDGIEDARRVAGMLGFPHYILDFTEAFQREVIDDFVGEYLAGRTPNPCVVCNRKIKWEELLRKARSLGADCVATGHYARVKRDKTTGRYFIARGRDAEKDQSYALWGLTQESLSRTLFPLADLTKKESRAIGERLGLPVAGKGESYEICFIPDDNYERFLKERRPALEKEVDGGEMLMGDEVVGRHRGFPFYTIGQRKGLGVARGRPVYVTQIESQRNRITLGEEADLYHTGLIAGRVNLMKYPLLEKPLRVLARIRYKDEGGMATIHTSVDGRVRVVFDEKRRAITPGQSVVFYEGDDLLGGGTIQEALPEG